MDGFMEITVSTGTLHHRYGAGEGFYKYFHPLIFKYLQLIPRLK